MPPVDITSTVSGTTAARQLARLLKQRDKKLVLAESCTGGLIASWLTKIPGVSAHFCGSAVVYRNETKCAWLGVPREKLNRSSPVSKVVAEAMARGVLRATPEADLSASITGHFGPDAPASQDGLFFVGIAVRDRSAAGGSPRLKVHRFRFPQQSNDATPRQRRKFRQQQAGRIVCQLLMHYLQ